jgi:hypothetical protein
MLIPRWLNRQVTRLITQMLTNLAAEFDSGDKAYRKDIFPRAEIILLRGCEWADCETGHRTTMARSRKRETSLYEPY